MKDSLSTYAIPKKTSHLARLALLSALAKVHAIPAINTSSENTLSMKLRMKRLFLGVVDTQKLSTMNPSIIGSLQTYLTTDFISKDSLLKGSFSFIVDTGCSCSCSPSRE